jgi:hypothetical protein
MSNQMEYSVNVVSERIKFGNNSPSPSAELRTRGSTPPDSLDLKLNYTFKA